MERGDLTEGFLRYRFGGLIHAGAYFRNFTASTDFCTQGNVSSELASLGSLFLKVLKNKEKLERKKDSVVTSESMKEQFEIYLYCLSFIQFTLFYFLQFLIFQFSVFKLYYSQNTRPPKN